MKIKKLEIIGFFFTIIFGTLSHFFYNWSGKNQIIGYFCPINESTWEHLKMLIVPILLYSLFEYFIVRQEYKNFIQVKSLSIIIAMCFISSCFFTYSAILGTNLIYLDIFVYFLGVFSSFLFSYYALSNSRFFSLSAKKLGISILILLIFSLFAFTYSAPNKGIFSIPFIFLL